VRTGLKREHAHARRLREHVQGHESDIGADIDEDRGRVFLQELRETPTRRAELMVR
jgi:hypothetical protein